MIRQEARTHILKEMEKEENKGFFMYHSQNAATFTNRALMLLDENDDVGDNMINMFDKGMYRLTLRYSGDHIRGLYNRKVLWTSRDQEHDDNTSISSTGYFGLNGHSKDILWYAKEMKRKLPFYMRYIPFISYSYDNVHPWNWAAKYLRQPFDVVVYKINAKKYIGLGGALGILHLFLKILFQELIFELKSETSSKLLTYARLKSIKHKWYAKPCVWLYNFMLRCLYKNGIEDVIAIYHWQNDDDARAMRAIAKGVKYLK